MMRTKDSARLYNVRFRFVSSRRKTEDGGKEGTVLMTGKEEELEETHGPVMLTIAGGTVNPGEELGSGGLKQSLPPTERVLRVH
jgi:hypothetical protein